MEQQFGEYQFSNSVRGDASLTYYDDIQFGLFQLNHIPCYLCHCVVQDTKLVMLNSLLHQFGVLTTFVINSEYHFFTPVYYQFIITPVHYYPSLVSLPGNRHIACKCRGDAQFIITPVWCPFGVFQLICLGIKRNHTKSYAMLASY